MAVVARILISFFFFISIVQCRILRLNSSDDHLISDGVENRESSFKTNTYSGLSIPNSCDHQYGFLPCAENAAGYLFQIVVYQGLLIFGEKQIGSGSKVLFNITGAGKFGGIIFRILMALPSMMLMIVSGIFSSKENAQSQVSVGVGIYAGITVFSLTIQWGVCLIFGRSDLKGKSENDGEPHKNCCPEIKKLAILKDSGVHIDRQTCHTAGIMLLSLIPYVVVQLVDVFNPSSGKRIINLIALIVASLFLLSYFSYQILDPWMQKRSLDYSKYNESLREGFFQHMQRQGELVDEDGKLNTQVVKKLFAETDKDSDGHIDRDELKHLVLDIINNCEVKVEKNYAVSKLMSRFDSNHSGSINEEEFIKGCENWICKTDQSSKKNDLTSRNIFHELFPAFNEKKKADSLEIARIMSKILKYAESLLPKSEPLITYEGKPNVESIKTLFKQFDTDGDRQISESGLEKILSSIEFGESHITDTGVLKQLVMKEFAVDDNNKIDETEFVGGVEKWLKKAIRVTNTVDMTRIIDKFDKIVWKETVYGKAALIMSVFQVLLGIVILTFLGGPLMVSILQLSYAMRLPSFGISFVVVPFAMNLRVALKALFLASEKSATTASLTFSEIYGVVIMNNIAGLTALLAIVYGKDLTWNFSAEVLTILVVCAVIGILAYFRTTYQLWTCILAFALYPFSLGLFYFVQVYLSWN